MSAPAPAPAPGPGPGPGRTPGPETTNRPAIPNVARRRLPWTIALATALIGAAWYLSRADVIAVARPGDTWTRMTGPALPASNAFVGTLLLFGIIPAMLAPALLGREPKSLGVGLGDWRLGVKLLAIGVPLAAIVGYIGRFTPLLNTVYPLGGALRPVAGLFALHAAGYLLYYLGFEYLFRGFLLLGLADTLGETSANLLQAALATLFHLGKAPGEFVAVLPASLLFGWLALRTGSIWYGVALHWVAGVTLDLLLVFGR